MLDQRAAGGFENAFAGLALLVAHWLAADQNMMIEILFP